MARMMIARLIHMLGVLIFLGTLVFILLEAVPGDPVTVMLGEATGPAEVEALRHQLGLEGSFLTRYVKFWGRMIRLDFGTSVFTGRPIGQELWVRLRMTGLLAFFSVTFALIVGMGLGWLAAIREGRWSDRAIIALATLGVAIPSFWLAPMLMLLFSVKLGWLPVSGSGTWKHLVLPTITLGSGLAAYLTRFCRTSFLDTFRQPFVLAARSRGLNRMRFLMAHILKPSTIPIVTVAGLQLGALLTGTVITETIFAWPGMGRYLVEGIFSRDYPVVQACVLVFGFIYACTNTLVDGLYLWLDPRTRREDM